MKTGKIISDLLHRLFNWQEIDLIRWIDMVWNAIMYLLRRHSRPGMYEVLRYESTLELLDVKGRSASFSKVEEVRYLQDNIIAYQDQAWGDGQVLIKYRCTPGVPVDFYKPGKKTKILISRRENMKSGDVDTFYFSWKITNGFTRNHEQWETEIEHLTKLASIKIIFPRARPPIMVSRIISGSNLLSNEYGKVVSQLPDGRWLCLWDIKRPKRGCSYILSWNW